MSNQKLFILNSSSSLKKEIDTLQKELEDLNKKIYDFETILRSHLVDEIIEEQELTVRYKKIKREKKEKRLEQKRKGKNYKKFTGLKKTSNTKKAENKENEQEKKRLYKEALLYVHPDTFSLKEEKIDVSTELTSKLIEVYQTGSLQELKNFHTYIFSGDALGLSIDNTSIKKNDMAYLKQQKETLEKRIREAKDKHTYKVLHEYENPLTFINELKMYYNDRLVKLRKRTRHNKS